MHLATYVAEVSEARVLTPYRAIALHVPLVELDEINCYFAENFL